MTSVNMHDMHTDEHDLGLWHDLAIMRSRWLAATKLDRRGALRLLGAAGAGLLLAACGGDKNNDANSSTSTSPEATPTSGSGSGLTTRSPSETGGPFPADGSNGPNVLDDSDVVRSDITKSFGEYSGTATGVPLMMNLKIAKAGSGEPYPYALMYLWHCDAQGRYSLYSQGATEQNYCRGVQAAGASGVFRFKTVFPGAYPGRWPHFHYEVFAPGTPEGSLGDRLLTSQIALPEEPCNAVYEDASRYPSSARSMQSLSLESDGVFRDSYRAQMAAVTGSPSAGYTLTFTAVV